MNQQTSPTEGLRAMQKRQRQEAILGAARKVFMTKGRDASTIDEIAALAGVSSLTVFNYFRDKDALFLATWTAFRKEAHSEMRTLVDSLVDQPPMTLIETYLLRLMRVSVGEDDRTLERRLWCDFYAAHYANTGKGSDDLVRFEDDMILADLQHILQQSIDRGACNPTAATIDIAEAILAIGNLHWVRWLTSDGAENNHRDEKVRVHHTLRQVRLFVGPLLGQTEQQGESKK